MEAPHVEVSIGPSKLRHEEKPLEVPPETPILLVILAVSLVVLLGVCHGTARVAQPVDFILRSFEPTNEQLTLQLDSLSSSLELLDEQQHNLKQRWVEERVLAEKKLAATRKESEIAKALKIVLKGRIADTQTTVGTARAQLKGAIEEIPIPKSQPAVGTPVYGQGAAQMNEQQRIAAMFDNEFPSEPVDANPGPAYVPPPEKWPDLGAEDRNTKRREEVVDAFLHSWNGYVQYAWGKDELQPRSKTAKNWNEASTKGMGLTILDSLTTMYLMNLTEPLDKALEWVREDLDFNLDVEASAFESTIRCVGSLVSIYELTGETDKGILAKAVDLADRLMWVFNTSTALPHSTVNLRTKRHWNQQWAGGGSILSEFGTMQLEFRTLSYHTKNPIYDMKVTHAMSILLSKCPKDMLCPTYMSTKRLHWMTDHISVGALGDSFYEYLLKQYLLTGKTEDRYKDAYTTAAHAIVDKLVFYSRPSNWAYIAEYRRREYYHKMDHLACFAAGMLAFGAKQTGDDNPELMEVAKSLTETCTKMYTRQKSGVSPEYVEFPGGGDFINGPGYYILRPEAMEAVFYMWRLTKDQKWRDVGWQMFSAINRWCRNEVGYVGLKDVNVKQPIKDNLQQSFWMAETLKYSFLLFADDSTLNLDQWVLNTEGHPLKIRKRDPLDVWRAYENGNEGIPLWEAPDIRGINEIETETMRSRRAKGKVRVPRRDPLGEEMEESAADDDGGPFDDIHGMDGIPKKSALRRKPPLPISRVGIATVPPKSEVPKKHVKETEDSEAEE